jgi:hypothetical protein
MRIVGDWFLFDDGESRPILRAKLWTAQGTTVTEQFLVDTKADVSTQQRIPQILDTFQNRRDIQWIGGQHSSQGRIETIPFGNLFPLVFHQFAGNARFH